MSELSGEIPRGREAEISVVSKVIEEVPVDIDQAKKELLDPRTISKLHDQEGRSAITSQITQARADRVISRVSIPEKEAELQQINSKTRDLHLQRGKKLLELEQRLEKVLVRLKSGIGIVDKKASRSQEEIEAIEIEVDGLLTQSKVIKHELDELRERYKNAPDPQEFIEAYYEKVQHLPLTNEQKRKLLRPEILARLSTKEYVALWRRLNPYFLSHVTRQGFRDHNAMFYHSSGMKKFHDGFINILKDDSLLRPPLALQGLRTRDESAIKELLSDWVLQAEDEATAKERLNSLLNFSLASAPKYPDKIAVHFAAQIVADRYYGGEIGNEVFFIYPSDVLASQHSFAFNGWEKDFTRPQSEEKWNDVFVWPETLNNPGISVNAGLVFLPEATPVDPDTGSKYASEVKTIGDEEERIMIEDTELVSSFVKWGERLNEQSPVIQVFKEYKRERNYNERQALERYCRDVFKQELLKIGFMEDSVMVLTNELIGELMLRESLTEELLQEIVREAGVGWRRAENTVSAKEYWESYFEKNPNLRPRHVIYYDGDPSTAVYKFLQENGIGRADTSESDGELLGFDDHHVEDIEKDPRAKVGYDELVDIANKIISDHFKHLSSY